jgi:hypothetical protein
MGWRGINLSKLKPGTGMCLAEPKKTTRLHEITRDWHRNLVKICAIVWFLPRVIEKVLLLLYYSVGTKHATKSVILFCRTLQSPDSHRVPGHAQKT